MTDDQMNNLPPREETSEEEQARSLPAQERERDMRPISAGLCDGEVCGEAARCLQCDLRFGITGHRLWSDYTDEERKGAQA